MRDNLPRTISANYVLVGSSMGQLVEHLPVSLSGVECINRDPCSLEHIWASFSLGWLKFLLNIPLVSFSPIKERKRKRNPDWLPHICDQSQASAQTCFLSFSLKGWKVNYKYTSVFHLLEVWQKSWDNPENQSHPTHHMVGLMTIYLVTSTGSQTSPASLLLLNAAQCTTAVKYSCACSRPYVCYIQTVPQSKTNVRQQLVCSSVLWIFQVPVSSSVFLSFYKCFISVCRRICRVVLAPDVTPLTRGDSNRRG